MRMKMTLALATAALLVAAFATGKSPAPGASPAARHCLGEFRRLLADRFDPAPRVHGAGLAGTAGEVDHVGDRWRIAAVDPRTGEEVLRATCVVTGPDARVALLAASPS